MRLVFICRLQMERQPAKNANDLMKAPHRAGEEPNQRGRPKADGWVAASGARAESVQSLLRALGILNRLSEAEDGMALTRIAEHVRLAPSTVHRLLTTLEQARYVRFDPERRMWSVGVQTFLSGRAFLRTRDLVGAARPYMRMLMSECRATVNLAVEENREAIYVHQIEHPTTIRAFSKGGGGRVPLYCSAVGKAMLAARTDNELDSLLPGHEAPRITANTIVSRSALREEIALIRERGFAIDDEEHAIGLRCVAALVFNELRRPMAAISVSGPAERISPTNIPRFGELLVRNAAEITAKLGGSIPEAFRRV